MRDSIKFVKTSIDIIAEGQSGVGPDASEQYQNTYRPMMICADQTFAPAPFPRPGARRPAFLYSGRVAGFLMFAYSFCSTCTFAWGKCAPSVQACQRENGAEFLASHGGAA